jgi:hypothetical protein
VRPSYFQNRVNDVLSLDFYINLSVSDLYIPRMQMGLINECRNRNREIEHYNSALEITGPRSFISGDTYVGTRHLYWILTGPSFAVHFC